MIHCRETLIGFVRRWAAYLSVVAIALGVATYALAALSAIPLLWALSNGLATLWILPAYGMVSAACLAVADPLLRDRRLRDAERFIPVAARSVFFSDLVVGLWALLPLLGVLLAGTWATFAARPNWLTCTPTMAVLSMAASVAFGAWMSALRLRLKRSSRPVRRGLQSRRLPAMAATDLRALHGLRAAVWLPVWRGVAPRSRGGLLTGWVVTCSLALATLLWPRWSAWWLSAAALSCNAIALWTAGALRSELHRTLTESRFVPISRKILRLGAFALISVSAALSMAPIGAVVQWYVPHHTISWLVYLSGSLSALLLQLGFRPRDPVNRGALWLLCTAALVAMASEVPLG